MLHLHTYIYKSSFWHFFQNPGIGKVYNMGGGRNSSCSVLEAIIKTEKIARKSFDYKIIDQNRSGDHMWWVSDVRKFKSDYPSWDTSYNIDSILEELIFSNPKRDGN